MMFQSHPRSTTSHSQTPKRPSPAGIAAPRQILPEIYKARHASQGSRPIQKAQRCQPGHEMVPRCAQENIKLHKELLRLCEHLTPPLSPLSSLSLSLLMQAVPPAPTSVIVAALASKCMCTGVVQLSCSSAADLQRHEALEQRLAVSLFGSRLAPVLRSLALLTKRH